MLLDEVSDTTAKRMLTSAGRYLIIREISYYQGDIIRRYLIIRVYVKRYTSKIFLIIRCYSDVEGENC